MDDFTRTIIDDGVSFILDNGGGLQIWSLPKTQKTVEWSNYQFETIQWFKTYSDCKVDVFDGGWVNNLKQK